MKKLVLVVGVLLYGSIASAQTTYNLAWDASQSPDVQGYYLYVGLQPGSYIQQIDAGNGTSWQITLNPGTHYLVVRAYGGTDLSAPSNVLTITVPTTDTQAPTAPNSISATAASTSQINVSWSASSDNVAVTQYRVERCAGSGCTAFTQIATSSGTSYSNSGLSASTSYRYRVRAADAAGNLSAYSATASASTQLPAAPSSLSVALNVASPTTSLVLSWGDNSSIETGFRIERGLTSTSFSQVASVGANVRTYTITGLLPGTLYYFRVAAYNSAGTSAYSNLASLATLTVVLPNTAPTVSIAAPVAGASYPHGATISFSGSASDTQDGNLSSSLIWTSNLAGQIGTGASFSRTLAAGSHTITARASDSGGMSGQRQVSIAVAAPPSGTLSVTQRLTNGINYSDLRWSGLSGTSVDVYRNGTRIAVVPNWGNMSDKSLGATYKVCTSGTTTCTNNAQAGSVAAPSSGTLSVTERLTNGINYSDLRWSGLSGTSVDVYRNGTRIAVVPNWGSMSDKSIGSTYKVCTSGTTTCTNNAQAGS